MTNYYKSREVGLRREAEMTHRWWFKQKVCGGVASPVERGTPCRPVLRGRLGSVLWQLEDGSLVVAPRFAARRKKGDR